MTCGCENECKGKSINDKGVKEIYENFVGKISDLLDKYDTLKDIFVLVKDLAKDDEIVDLAKKIATLKDKELYVLLAAAILRVIKDEMLDGDGVFDYEPST